MQHLQPYERISSTGGVVLKNYYKTNSQKNWKQKFTTAE